MAHLWRNTRIDSWEPIALDRDDRPLIDADLVGSPQPPSTQTIAVEPVPRVRRMACSTDEVWVLLARPEAQIRVNGLSLDLGIVVLSDRDEIRLPWAPPLYFSTERLAEVTPYPSGLGGFCPRCKDAIKTGSAAVRCPSCGLWHHAADERPCWTYGEQCAACEQPTALDVGFRWTPEEI